MSIIIIIIAFRDMFIYNMFIYNMFIYNNYVHI